MKIKRISWKNKRIPQGKEPEDIVQEAIVDLLDGTRKWNHVKTPDLLPDLLTYLKSVVDSKISNLYSTKEYKITQSIQTNKNSADINNFLNNHQIDGVNVNVEDTLIEKETQNLILETVKGDKKLEDLLLLIMEGYTKPAEIAQHMKIDVKDVYNLKKRLCRACRNVLDKTI